MKAKTWRVTLCCVQTVPRGDLSNYQATYRVTTQTARAAISRALAAWQRETGKRLGATTQVVFTVTRERER